MTNTVSKMLESRGSNGRRKASSMRGSQGSLGWRVGHRFRCSIRVALMEKMALEGVNLLGEELSQQRNEPQQSLKAGRRPTLPRKGRSRGAGKQSRGGAREVAGNREGLGRTWLLLCEEGSGRVPSAGCCGLT